MTNLKHTGWLLLLLLVTACSQQQPVASGEVDPETGIAFPKDPKSTSNDSKVMALFMDATRLRLMGDHVQAVSLYEKCLKEDPKNGAVMFELAKLYNGQQRGPEALDMANGALETDKDNIWYHFLVADLSQQAGKTDEAIKIYEQVIERWPNRYEVYLDLAQAYAYSGDSGKSSEVFRKLEKQFGPSEELVFTEYQMLMASGDLEGAKTLVERMVVEEPQKPQYRGMLADIYQQMGESEKAYAEYQKVLDMNPDDSMMRIAMAEYLYENERKTEAFEQLELAFSDPDLEIDAKMHVLLSFFEMTQGSKDEEELAGVNKLMDVLETTHPESGKPYTIHGDFLLREGKFDEARAEFRKALEFEQDKFAIWQQLVMLDSQLGDNKAMQEDSEAATELFPSQPLFYLFNGIALEQQKRYDEAIEVLTAGRDMVIDDPQMEAQFLSSLGSAHNSAKNFEESDRAFDSALEINPDDPLVLNNYSYFLSERNELLEKAAKMSKRSNEIAPSQPSYQDTYAWVLYKDGKFDMALEWIEKALASGGSTEGVIVEHHGDILFKLGRTEEAIDRWKAAKEIGGVSELLEQKLAEGKLIE